MSEGENQEQQILQEEDADQVTVEQSTEEVEDEEETPEMLAARKKQEEEAEKKLREKRGHLDEKKRPLKERSFFDSAEYNMNGKKGQAGKQSIPSKLKKGEIQTIPHHHPFPKK